MSSTVPSSPVRSESRRFPGLDGVRALAAFAVVATHTGFNSGRSIDNGPFAPLLARLDFGVTLFFLLSGFVIYRPFVVGGLAGRRLPPVRPFLLRRAARILPAYWLTVTVVLTFFAQRPAGPAQWMRYLLLSQTYLGGSVDASLTQMWTLSVELMFYLLVPLAAWWACAPADSSTDLIRRNLTVFAGMAVVAVGANIVEHACDLTGSQSLIWLPANLDWFALGMLLALISASTDHFPGKPVTLPPWFATARTIAASTGLCWALAALVFWFATLPVAGPRLLLVPTGWEWSIKHYLYGSCAVLLLLPLTLGSADRASRALRSPPMRYLGEVSYGVYLWHLMLLIALQRWLGYRTFEGHFWQLLLSAAAGAVVLASLSWRLLERPILRWSARFYRANRSGGDSPTSGRSTSDRSAGNLPTSGTISTSSASSTSP